MNNKEVFLKGGKGSKAKYNGKKANIRGNRKGGWIYVGVVSSGAEIDKTQNNFSFEIDESGDFILNKVEAKHLNVIKWRSNAWDTFGVKAYAVTLTDIPDALMR